MTLRDYKNELNREPFVVLNRTFACRGEVYQIAALVGSELWVLGSTPRQEADEEWDDPRPMTRRESITRRLGSRDPNLSIREITVDGVTARIGGSSWQTLNPAEDGDPFVRLSLRYLLSRGLDTGPLDDCPMERLGLSRLHTPEGEAFPPISPSSPITLATWEQSIARPVGMRFSVPIGTGIDKPFTFTDPETGKKQVFYLTRVCRHDLKGETAKLFETQRQRLAENGMSEEEIEKFRLDQAQHVEEICPQGMDMLLVEYEIQSGDQLTFYTTEYLDAIEGPCSRSFGMIYGSRTPSSHPGFRPRQDMLTPISRDFTGNVELELFFWYDRIPGETLYVR